MARWLQKDPPGPAMLQDRCGLEEGQVWLPLLSFRPHPSSSLFCSAFTFYSVVMCHLILPSQWVAEGALVPKEAR